MSAVVRPFPSPRPIPEPKFKRRSGQHLGQLPEKDWPPIRLALRAQVAAIDEWLDEHRGPSPKARTVTAELLGVICKLYEGREGGYPFPVRRRLAERLSTTVDAIDRAISVSLAWGEITEEIRQSEGHIENAYSIRRERYIIPSEGLLHVCCPELIQAKQRA